MKRIGVLTSGGDCPGMNACLRAVVRVAIGMGREIWGIKRGYAGLIEGEMEKLSASSVSGIINLGGTFLKTARSEEFKTEEGQRKAVDTLKKIKIEGLIVIGGDGSLRGAWELHEKWNIPTVGVPATIDNDIPGTDLTIGFDTAVNTALEAIDRIRNTATSHERLFLIEVMGRESGFLALFAGLAGGCEDILIPELKTDPDEVCQKLEEGKRRGKTSSILVIAEGDEAGGAFEIGKKIKDRAGYETRVQVLGYIQRGGSPTATDRILGSRLGKAAVENLLKGKRGLYVGIEKGEIVTHPFPYVWEVKKEIDLSLYELSQILAK